MPTGARWKTRVMRGDEEILVLDPPLKKIILWHITHRCNLRCEYCYGTFDGSSYMETGDVTAEVPLSRMLETVEDLRAVGYERVHLCGGEPFLRRDIWDILQKIAENAMDRFIVSNFVYFPKNFEAMFARHLISSLSVSLDSVHEATNDRWRGQTARVIKNIKWVLGLKEKHNVRTEIGLNAVVTRKTVYELDDLIQFALDVGLNRLNFQLVYLPETHKYYDELSILPGSPEAQHLLKMYDKLAGMGEHFRVSGEALFEVSRRFVQGQTMSLVNCFFQKSPHYLAIDGSGDVRLCPCACKDAAPIGNIKEARLKDFLVDFVLEEDIVCEQFSTNCLGIWESAHPSTFDLRLA